VLYVIFYIFTFVIIFLSIEVFRKRHSPIPNLKFKKFGFVFYSKKIHKIRIFNYKVRTLEGVIYLSLDNKIAIIKNVKFLDCKNGFLYFKSLGEVKVVFECKEIYRYYNLKITSNEFKINDIKEKSKYEILNNLLNIQDCEYNKKFLFFLKNVLKIEINNKKIAIKSNNYKISYNLLYKLNGKIKKINILETL